MVLVTGASGFLGQHLVRYLSAQGKAVRALYFNHPPKESLINLSGVDWRPCNLLDVFDIEECILGITQIYHCAAIVNFAPEKRTEMLHFNVESTINIINAALQHNIEKFAYISSTAAIGRQADTSKEVSEEESWGESTFNSAYGISKYLAETEVWRGIGEGLNGVIINPGIILGAGNWQDGSAAIMNIAYKEFPFYTKGITSWVDVEDVVRIIYMLMESNRNSERYLVSSGNYTFKDVITLMANALNKKPPHIYANSFLTGIVWRWYLLLSFIGKKEIPITKETSISAHSNTLFNNQKLLKHFPDFQYKPIKQTIEQMANVFLTEKNKK